MGDPQEHDGEEGRVGIPFDPPKCSRCHGQASEMYMSDYEAMHEGKPAICEGCRDELIKVARIRSAAGNNGFRLGI